MLDFPAVETYEHYSQGRPGGKRFLCRFKNPDKAWVTDCGFDDFEAACDYVRFIVSHSSKMYKGHVIDQMDDDKIFFVAGWSAMSKERCEMRPKIQDIHESLLNGQRRQMVAQIDEYGTYTFWYDYQHYVATLTDNVQQQLDYFCDATISYHRVKAR